MNPANPPRTHKPLSRRIVASGIASTIVIGAGAFVLSFSALTDLAVRAGINPTIAWMWPLIVDGMIVAATVAIVALAGRQGREQFYPWILLFFGAIVSTAANSIHAILAVRAENGNVPVIVSALVAAMPPVVLLAITHLTVLLVQYARAASETAAARAAETDAEAAAAVVIAAEAALAVAPELVTAGPVISVPVAEPAAAAQTAVGPAAAEPITAQPIAAEPAAPAKPATRARKTADTSQMAVVSGDAAEEKPKAAPKRKPRKPAAATASRTGASTSAGSTSAASTGAASASAGSASAGGTTATKTAAASRPSARSGATSARPLVPGLSSVTVASPLLRAPSEAGKAADAGVKAAEAGIANAAQLAAPPVSQDVKDAPEAVNAEESASTEASKELVSAQV